MVQSLEHRMTDIEYIIAHLPDDLNARFAGVDVKMATIRETQLLHTQRFSTIARKIDSLESRMTGWIAGWKGWKAECAGWKAGSTISTAEWNGLMPRWTGWTPRST